MVVRRARTSCLRDQPWDPWFSRSPKRGLEHLVGEAAFATLPSVCLSSHPLHFGAPPSCSVSALKPFGAAGMEATQGFCELLWLQVCYWPEQRRFLLIGTEHGWPWSLRIMQFLTVWGWQLIVRLSSFVVWSWFVRLLAFADSQMHTEELWPSHPLSSPFNGFSKWLRSNKSPWKGVTGWSHKWEELYTQVL